MQESMIKKALKCLCLSNGWSYGVFWRFDQRNPILLTLEEAYFEEHARSTVNNMILEVHVHGEGIIGQTAFDQQHRWMFSDNSSGNCKLTCHLQSQDRIEDDSEFSHQFSSGIKTVALIPVESRGVVQFGSVQEILEEPEFVDQTRKLIKGTVNCTGLAENAPSSLIRDISDQSGLLASIILSQNPFCGNPKLTCMADTSAASTPCINMWNTGASTSTSFSQQVDSSFFLEPNISASWANALQNIQIDSLFDPFYIEGVGQGTSGDLVDHPNSNSLTHETKVEHEEGPSSLHMFEFKPVDYGASLFSPFQVDDAFQWLDASAEQCVTGLDAMITDNLFEEVDLIKPEQAGSGDLCCFPSTQLANSSHSRNSISSESCEKGKSFEFGTTHDELFHGLSPDFACDDPVIDKKIHLGIDAGLTRCISEVEGGSISGTWKGLFSELGLEQLLNDGPGASCVTKSSTEDECSVNKRRRVESFSTKSDQIQTTSHPLRMNSMQQMYNLKKSSSDFGFLKDFMPKGQVGLWIDDSYSSSAKSCITTAQPKKAEEPAKATKKGARPGESTRPRPKDRQMIQDRVRELRDIIPNGAKCSIDSLLDRTIKHMLFLQSLTKHADKFKQVNETRLISREDRVYQKPKSQYGGNTGGATWALEVGGQNMCCPIVVEDLGHAGQMLIEMLCEDKGLFLEIADLVRGFGLAIIKGVMEVRHQKIWAHFIVEANRHITRMDILIRLVQLMQAMATSGMNTTNEPGKVLGSTTCQYSKYQQPLVSLPVSLAEMLS